MKIVVLGGGPSGLYFALLARTKLGADVTVYEQNPRDATYGFGVVLADRGLNRLRAADAASHDEILRCCFVSRHRIISHRDESIFIEGSSYGAAIGRLRLLQILQNHAELAGARIHYNSRVSYDDFHDADLIVGADGGNSALRDGLAEDFGVSRYQLTNRLGWYGTTAPFAYPILHFKTTDAGHFWAVGYSYTERMSTFVAECDAETWICSGLSEMNEQEAAAYSSEVFRDQLAGQPLICNRSLWRALPVIRVRRWSVGNKVLIGDALHSAHPSIGSGTRIAMEDSIALTDALETTTDVSDALAAFERARAPTKQKLVDAAERSFTWYEGIAPKLKTLTPRALVFDYMARTGRVDEQRLTAEFPNFMAKYQSDWRAYLAATSSVALPSQTIGSVG